MGKTRREKKYSQYSNNAKKARTKSDTSIFSEKGEVDGATEHSQGRPKVIENLGENGEKKRPANTVDIDQNKQDAEEEEEERQYKNPQDTNSTSTTITTGGFFQPPAQTQAAPPMPVVIPPAPALPPAAPLAAPALPPAAPAAPPLPPGIGAFLAHHPVMLAALLRPASPGNPLAGIPVTKQSGRITNAVRIYKMKNKFEPNSLNKKEARSCEPTKSSSLGK